VLKAIKIMNLFSSAETRLSLTEVSHRLDMPKSTAHNLLRTLLSEGYIEKVDGDLYALGTAPLSLTQNIRVNVEIRDPAAPLLRRLADSSHESVYLTVLDGDYALYIYAVESPRRLLARSAVGERVPLHCTSVGKAIMSCLPWSQVTSIVERVGLKAFTPATITDLEPLKKELEQTRQRGYSLDREEHETGTFCVGAPIFNAKSRCIGSCSVSGRDPELTGSRLPELAPLVLDTAQQISRRMGFVADTPAHVSVLPAGSHP
jgi:DNA-binding IclR family transcriptional regulator